MGDLHAQVLAGFGLKAKKVVKERNGYVCNTQKGLVLIQKTNESCEHITFSHSVKECLQDADFSNIDRYWISMTNKPYVLLENETYVATAAPGFQEINFENNDDFLKALRETARMHALSDRIYNGFAKQPDSSAEINPAASFYRTLDLRGTFSKKLGELHSIKKRVGAKKRLSDFDVLFLKSYSLYENQLQEALSLLGQESSFGGSARRFCHNSLKEESLPVFNGKVHIVNFSHCGFMDTSLTDLSGMISRYIRKLPQTPVNIQDVLDDYLRINRLSPVEIRMLYPLLLYPEKFLKLCNYYYSKKRTWIPSAMIGRMEGLVLSREKALRYVEGLKK